MQAEVGWSYVKTDFAKLCVLKKMMLTCVFTVIFPGLTAAEVSIHFYVLYQMLVIVDLFKSKSIVHQLHLQEWFKNHVVLI